MATNTSDLTTELSLLLTELSGHPTVVPEQRLKEDLGLDSLGLVQLVMQLNSRWQIQVASSDLVPEHFATVATLLSYLEKRLEK